MLKAIIIDDEKYICQLIYHLVDWDALDVSVVGMAHSASDALQMIRMENPDIIITDVNMPDMTGLELVDILRKESSAASVIFVSGHRDFEFVQQALRLNAVDYLLKPIKEADLLAVLRRVTGMRRKEMQKQRKYAQLAQEHTDMVDKSRGAFVRDAVQGNMILRDISMEEVNAKYKTGFEWDSFIVGVIKFDSDIPLKKDFLEFAETKIKSMLGIQTPKCAVKTFFDSIDEHTYLIFNTDDADLVERFAWNFLQQATASILHDSSMHMTIGLSPVVSGAGSLFEAAGMGRDAVMERWVAGTDRVIHYTRPQTTGGVGLPNSMLKNALYGSFSKRDSIDTDAVFEDAKNMFLKAVSEGSSGKQVYEAYRDVITLLTTCVRRYFSKEEINRNFGLTEYQLGMASSIEGANKVIKNLYSNIYNLYWEKVSIKELLPIREAKNYVAQHYHEQISLGTVANYVGFNASYFSNYFKKGTGMNFVEYLIDYRIAKAKEYLYDPEKTAAQIAFEVGFNDEKYFLKTFKKKVGLTIREFRKLYC